VCFFSFWQVSQAEKENSAFQKKKAGVTAAAAADTLFQTRVSRPRATTTCRELVEPPFKAMQALLRLEQNDATPEKKNKCYPSLFAFSLTRETSCAIVQKQKQQTSAKVCV
jgi:hypothetical protein